MRVRFAIVFLALLATACGSAPPPRAPVVEEFHRHARVAAERLQAAELRESLGAWRRALRAAELDDDRQNVARALLGAAGVEALFERWDEVEALASRALREGGAGAGAAHARLLIGQARLGRGDADAALAEFTDAAGSLPADAPSLLRVALRVGEALAQIERREFDLAEAALREAAGAAQRLGEAAPLGALFAAEARLALAQGDHERAYERAEAARRHDQARHDPPAVAADLVLIGRALVARGDAAGARDAWTRAARIHELTGQQAARERVLALMR